MIITNKQPLLLLLFYSFSDDSGGRCSPVSAMVAVLLLLLLLLFPHLLVSLSEQEALLQLKNSLTNTAALDDTWVPTSLSPCGDNWTGAFCGGAGGANIVNLKLSDLGLAGTIDFEALSELKFLRGLYLDDNDFTGEIPAFHKLATLRTLSLNNTKLAGEISPDFFSTMNSLRWVILSNNNISGQIPESLKKLKYLKELHLDHNSFSGDIPGAFSELENLEVLALNDNQLSGEIPKSLTGVRTLTLLNLQNNKLSGEVPHFKETPKELNVANNNLTGEIPGDMGMRFKADKFEGNAGLCGAPLENQCPSDDDAPSAPSPSLSSEESKLLAAAEEEVDRNHKRMARIAIVVITGVSVTLMILLLVIRYKRKDDDVLGKGRMMNLDDSMPRHENVVEVHVPGERMSTSSNASAIAQTAASNRKSAGDSKKGSVQANKNSGELLMVSDLRGPFGLTDLMKASAEVLGNGGLGSAYKAVMGNGLSVVVKRMREMNRLGREGFDAEMRRFGRLRHKNILTPLAYLYRREEKLLISDYVPRGSLVYILHGDRGASHSELIWPKRLKIIQGIAKGMEYLHTEFAAYDLPHGNLKSSNILLQEDYEPVLNDYALHPLVNPASAAQALSAFKSPEYLESQDISPKADVYCLGVVVLEILTGKFPSQYLTHGKGGTDVVQWVHSAAAENREQELLDPEIQGNTKSVKHMVQLLKIGADCTKSTADQRPDIKDAVSLILEVQV